MNTTAHRSHQLVRRDLPFIYQRDKVQSCTSASSTSIISGGKAVDFAAFAAGVLTLVLNVNNNGKENKNFMDFLFLCKLDNLIFNCHYSI